MRLASFAISVLLSIALINNGIEVDAKRKKKSKTIEILTTGGAAEDPSSYAPTTTAPPAEPQRPVSEVPVNQVPEKPKEEVPQSFGRSREVSDNGASPSQSPASEQAPVQAVGNVNPEVKQPQPPYQPSMYYPQFPFYYPFQMMQSQPQVQVNPLQPGQQVQAAQPGEAGMSQSMGSGMSQSMGQGQMSSLSQGAYPGMLSVSNFGSPTDENGNQARFAPPVPGMFFNPYAYGYNGYNSQYNIQPGVAYREVYFPTKDTKAASSVQTEAPTAKKGSSSVEAKPAPTTEKPVEARKIEVSKDEKPKCRRATILYHANVKPLTKEKKESLTWLNDPKSAVCNEPFLACECNNNATSERRWSFDYQSNKCVLYEDPCPGKNKNSFTALNECLVSCWRM